MADPRLAVRAVSLYRSLLRAHKRHLPLQMKELGDAYVKSEFRLHKKTTQSEQIQQFLTEWDRYLEQILMTARAQDHARSTEGSNGVKGKSAFQFGTDLPRNVELTEEQLAQLEKLREESSNARKS
jgi:hypothetical protein